MKEKILIFILVCSCYMATYAVNGHVGDSLISSIKVDTSNNKITLVINLKNNSFKEINLLWSDKQLLTGSCNSSFCMRLFFLKKDSSYINFKNPKIMPLYDGLYRIIKIPPKENKEITLVFSDYYNININDFLKVICSYSNNQEYMDKEKVFVGKLAAESLFR